MHKKRQIVKYIHIYHSCTFAVKKNFIRLLILFFFLTEVGTINGEK